MKRSIRSSLISGLALATLLSVGVMESKAATPVAPVLSVVGTKIFDGHLHNNGGKAIFADGTTFYAICNTPGNMTRYLKLVRSTDGGVTWKGAHTIFTSDENLGGLGDSSSVSVSGDAVFPTQKIIHMVWSHADRIYYNWADTTNIDDVVNRLPIDITGSASPGNMPQVVTSPKGAVHVMYRGNDGNLYYSSATDHEAGFFNAPIAVTTITELTSDYEFTMDKAGNLHLAYSTSDGVSKAGLKYKKLTAGSSTWSTAVYAQALTPYVNFGTFASITTFDANNLYIAANFDDTNLNVYSSSNGGATWTKKTVFTKTATLSPTRHTSIAVNAAKTFTVANGFDVKATDGTTIREDAKLFRSTDGVTWSAPTTVAGITSTSLAVDSNGKVGMATYSGSNFEGEVAVYFSKEK